MDITKLKAGERAQLAALLAKVQASGDETPAAAKKRKSREIKYLTEPQLERLLKAAAVSVRDLAILTVAYCRGLRAAEIGALQLGDWIERDDRLVIHRLKGSAGGEYHLTKREVRVLKAWVRERGREAGPLFPSNRGTGISQQMLDCLMKRYGMAAGLPPELCHMHALKHSCGTHLLNRGESIEDVQDHLGHRQVANTLVYARYTNTRRHARDRRLRDW
jgi:integrase